MKNVVPIVIMVIAMAAGLLWFFYDRGMIGDTTGEGTSESQKEVAHDVQADQNIQAYTLEERKKLATVRFPGDTLDLMEYVLKNYEEGSYLLDVDKTFSTNTPRSAVIYMKGRDSLSVFALIAKSKKEDERFVEIKNLIGYDASFIDMDSTELGTAYFFLTLFTYADGTFNKVWEAPVPTHGGFNFLTLKSWEKKKIPYVEVLFHDAQDIGHIAYNYFFIHGVNNFPHLVASYEGINSKRSLTDANGDIYPDYIEYVYYDSGREVRQVDSVTFLYKSKDSLYVNTRNPRQTRKYENINFEDIPNK